MVRCRRAVHGNHRQWCVTERPDLRVERFASDDVDAIFDRVCSGFWQLSPDALRLGSPDIEQPPILVAAHRLDEYHACRLVGMRMREQSHQEPAVGVAHQYVRRRDAGLLQELL
jgi:hypothetical protein